MISPSSSYSSSSIVMCPEKLVTRDLSNMSIEAYHGGEAASVPFMWESEPGTPKFKCRDVSLPPLTPPPSYYYSTSKSNKGESKKSPKPNLLQTIFIKRTARKQRALPSPASPSSSISSPSSSSSLFSSPAYSSVPSSPAIFPHNEEEDVYDVAVHSSARFRGGGCSSMIMKTLLRDLL